eukprot:CAMPEP_0115548978 /NCGR_PEP_ID=MMETSP0271-20121206/94446_1 /TAXON_ID=71861 /ORGANISM="Scrippsiella trochoidea, Strain CCMP3099" /LENGTH=207 /DNA_ID=CAMNT_0002982469 /DNA_START=68 /DNA_END=694 /DNA_ORIENTATION=+
MSLKVPEVHSQRPMWLAGAPPKENEGADISEVPGAMLHAAPSTSTSPQGSVAETPPRAARKRGRESGMQLSLEKTQKTEHHASALVAERTLAPAMSTKDISSTFKQELERERLVETRARKPDASLSMSGTTKKDLECDWCGAAATETEEVKIMIALVAPLLIAIVAATSTQQSVPMPGAADRPTDFIGKFKGVGIAGMRRLIARSGL